ncbi:hypothetical protein EGI22_01210 [Lacihabitans sp. LS3-19]|nr:hypothetical protein [Lacihabitans sp. LS3-19]
MLPTLVGFVFFKKLKVYFKVLWLSLFLGNLLMLISNVDVLSKHFNTHYFYYYSILISGICFPLFFSILLRRLQNVILLFPIFIVIFLSYDYYKTGFKEMNILPYIFIDFFNIVACILAFRLISKLDLSLKYFLGIHLFYSFYDVVINFASSYFYKYLNERIFNLIWYKANPVVGLVYYTFLAYVFYVASKEQKPNFEKIKDFNN